MYRVTVELLLDVDDYGSACDVVAETLRELMHDHAPASSFLDWQYVEGGSPRPTEGSEFIEWSEKQPAA